MNWARECMLCASSTSSWWNSTLERPDCCSRLTASTPLFWFLAVKTTVTPAVASCRTVSKPMPLFAPVTTAYLETPNRSAFSSSLIESSIWIWGKESIRSLPRGHGWVIELHRCNYWIFVFNMLCQFSNFFNNLLLSISSKSLFTLSINPNFLLLV